MAEVLPRPTWVCTQVPAAKGQGEVRPQELVPALDPHPLAGPPRWWRPRPRLWEPAQQLLALTD